MLKRLRFMPLSIPFVQEFSHAQKSRNESDSLYIVVELIDGSIGFGEALVRPYVTGETREMVSACLKEAVLPLLQNFPWELLEASADIDAQFFGLQNALHELWQQLPIGPIAWNGMRCALEIALLDILLQKNQVKLERLIPSRRSELFYSGILSASHLEKTLQSTRHFMQIGISDLKLKISSHQDLEIIKALRDTFGEKLRLRLDANSAFDLPSAIKFCQSVEAYSIAAIEQPMERGPVAELAELQAATSVPIMVDESLISERDALELVEARACRVFNIRLAKNGGLGPSLQLAKIAEQAGVAVQIGALVGETALLSAVGRQLAASLPELFSLEGSFGTLLLKQDVSRQSIRFGFAGRAPLLKEKTMGIEVLTDRLESFLEKEMAWEVRFS